MPGPWIDLDLSSAIFYTDGSGTPWGKYEGGKIVTNTGYPDFSIPGLVLDKGTMYEMEITWDVSTDTGDYGFWVYGISGLTQAEYMSSSWRDLSYSGYSYFPYAKLDGYKLTILLGTNDWWTAADMYGGIYPLMESTRYSGVTAIRYRAISMPAQAGSLVHHSIVGGSTAGSGGSSGSPTPISLNQISAPTLLAADEEAWFSFTATESGLVTIDSLLSYDYNLGVIGNLDIGEIEIYLDGHNVESDNGASVTQVTAGLTYQIMIHNYLGSPTVVYARVSPYGTNTDWFDYGENEIVLNNGIDDPHYVPTTGVGVVGGDGSVFAHDPFHGLYGATAEYNLWQAFGGPIPMTDSSSWDCGWRWSRRGVSATQWWSVDGGVEWGGSGTCTSYPSSYQPDMMGGGGIGIAASTDAGGFLTPAFTHFSSNAMAIYVSLHNVTRQLGKYAGRFFDQDVEVPDLDNPYLIWETDGNCTITEFAVAPDEPTTYSSSAEVTWWMNYTKDNFVDTNENPEGYWGPSRYSGGTSPVWRSNGDGPEGAISRAHQVIPDYTGGAADWTVIDQTFIDAAYALEEESDWFYSTPPDRAALRFIGIHHATTSDVLPSELVLPTAIPGSTVDRRDYQGVSMKIKALPVRHRWAMPHDIPDMTLDLVLAGWTVGEDLISA